MGSIRISGKMSKEERIAARKRVEDRYGKAVEEVRRRDREGTLPMLHPINMGVDKILEKVTFPVEARIRDEEHKTTVKYVKDWKDVFNIMEINNEEDIMWDFNPTTRTGFNDHIRKISSNLIAGTAKDIYDYKEFINEFNSGNSMNMLALAPFSMDVKLDTKEINVSICVLSTDKINRAIRREKTKNEKTNK